MACIWIINKGSIPPVLFDDLVKEEVKDERLLKEINYLLDLKANSTEKTIIDKNEYLDNWINKQINKIEDIANNEKVNITKWDLLNSYLLEILILNNPMMVI